MPSKSKAAKAKTAVAANPAAANPAATNKKPDKKATVSAPKTAPSVQTANVKSPSFPSLKSVGAQAKSKPAGPATKSISQAAAPQSGSAASPATRPAKAAAKVTAAGARKASKPGEGAAAKPVDTKPGDTKPGDTKLVDTKPGDTKPVDTKSGEMKRTRTAGRTVVSGEGQGESSFGRADQVATAKDGTVEPAGAPADVVAEAAALTHAGVRSAQTKNVAAALMAARRNTRPVVPQVRETKPLSGQGIDTVKGTVEVADKNVKKAIVEHETGAGPAERVAAAPAAAAVSSGMMRRPGGLPQRAAVSAPPADKAGAKSAKPAAKGQGFKTNEFIVYPAHGVGEIVAIEEQVVAGYKLELFVISFIKDKMILKVPLPKIASVGMRKLAEPHVVKRALDTLTGRARIKRTMWSRRAQEYEAKINSGDLVAIAEVVRDLYRSDAQPEQSYSERQLYEAALDRMAREISVVQALTDTEALKVIDEQLRKGPRRGKAEETEADDTDEPEDVDGEIGAAA